MKYLVIYFISFYPTEASSGHLNIQTAGNKFAAHPPDHFIAPRRCSCSSYFCARDSTFSSRSPIITFNAQQITSISHFWVKIWQTFSSQVPGQVKISFHRWKSSFYRKRQWKIQKCGPIFTKNKSKRRPQRSVGILKNCLQPSAQILKTRQENFSFLYKLKAHTLHLIWEMTAGKM